MFALSYSNYEISIMSVRWYSYQIINQNVVLIWMKFVNKLLSKISNKKQEVPHKNSMSSRTCSTGNWVISFRSICWFLWKGSEDIFNMFAVSYQDNISVRDSITNRKASPSISAYTLRSHLPGHKSSNTRLQPSRIHWSVQRPKFGMTQVTWRTK